MFTRFPHQPQQQSETPVIPLHALGHICFPLSLVKAPGRSVVFLCDMSLSQVTSSRGRRWLRNSPLLHPVCRSTSTSMFVDVDIFVNVDGWKYNLSVNKALKPDQPIFNYSGATKNLLIKMQHLNCYLIFQVMVTRRRFSFFSILFWHLLI